MKTSRPGFTLIEIIIAITLIAFFVTLPILAYSSYLKKTRDTQRKNSINQIQSALEQYRANNGKYPPTDTWKDVLVSQGYLPSIPKDPLDGQAVAGENGVYYGFDYQSSADGQSYQLSVRLEENQPGGKGYSNEKSYYTVSPEGPKIVYTTPNPSGGAGGGAGGTGSGTISSGNVTGTFTGTGSGTVTAGIITFTGTVTNGIFTGTFTGTVTGSGVTGTISGNYSGPISGNISGSVTGTGLITGGTVTGSTFTGTFGTVTFTPVSSGGLPSNTPIPTTSGLPTNTPTNTPTSIPTKTSTPINTLTPTNTPTNTPTITPSPTNTDTPSPTPTYTLTPTPTPTQIAFSKSMGGAGDDRGYKIVQTSDGGYVVAGSTNTYGAGGYDIYLAKFTSLGALSWTMTYGTAQTDGISVQGLYNTSDGGFLLGGSTDISGPQYNYAGLIIKVDSAGTIVWKTTLPQYSTIGSVAQISSSTYIAAGRDTNGGILVTLNSTNGAVSTYNKYSGFSNGFNKVIVDFNGGYTVFGGWSYYMVKLDSAANIQWARQITGGNGNDFISDGIQDPYSGYYLMAGSNGVTGVDGSRDMYVTKVDQSGNFVWGKRYNFGTGLQEGANAIKSTSDGGYIVVGYSDMTLAKMVILKIDVNGNYQWSRTFGPGSANSTAQDVIQTSDLGFAITGYTNAYSNGNQVEIVKLDKNGNYPQSCTEITNTTMTGTSLGAIAALSSTKGSTSGSSSPTISVGSGGALSDICF